jgi:hypothetical protein
MSALFVPGENDADNKKKSGSMSDDGTLFGSCSLSLSLLLCAVCSVIFSCTPSFSCADYFYQKWVKMFL